MLNVLSPIREFFLPDLWSPLIFPKTYVCRCTDGRT